MRQSGWLEGVDTFIGSQWGLALSTVALTLFVYVLPLAVDLPLLDPDEGLHASIAQEMVARDAWITPTFLGKPFLDKPILYFWALCLSLRFFGDHAAAIRFTGLMFGLFGAATTGALGWRMFGRRTGLVAAVLYATTLMPTALALVAVHDVALIPCINLAMLFLWESDRARTGQSVASHLLAAGLVLGLAVLAKGLIGVAVVGVAYGSWLLLSRRLRGGHCLRGLLVLLIAVLVASIWYLAVEKQNPGYFEYFFYERHLLGFTTTSQRHGEEPWWYYLPILLAGGLPWIAYLPIVVRDGLALRIARRHAVMDPGSPCESKDALGRFRPGGGQACADRHHPESAVALLWCWLIGWTLLMSLAGSKALTYIWPAFPVVALLAAVAWTRLIQGVLSEAARRWFARVFVYSIWGGPVVLPLAVWTVQHLFAVRYPRHVWLIASVAAATILLPLIPWRFECIRTALACVAFSLAVQILVVVAWLLPPVAGAFSARDLARHFNLSGRLPSRLFLADERVGSLVFYLDPKMREGLTADRLRRLKFDEGIRFQPGDVVAVPSQIVPRAEMLLHLAGTPSSQVGRHRLYCVTAETGGNP